MIKRFDYLTEDERRIRTEVFVEEQGFNEEFDTIDDSCVHLIKYIDNKAVGVCRLYRDGDTDTFHIGRVAVDKSCRGKNIGKILIDEAEKVIAEEGGKISAVSAQVRVQGFYEKCGYTPMGETYLDEHCPHIHMEKQIFRKMRRFRQLLPQEETETLLKEGKYGTLAVMGDMGYPYAVPLNYIYENGKIYFHCSKDGHKTDAIKENSKVSFSVVAKDDIVPEEYTTYFQSVTLFGKAVFVDSDEEKKKTLMALAEKYNPEGTEKDHIVAVEKEYKPVCLVAIEIHHLTGKECIELTKKRTAKNEQK